MGGLIARLIEPPASVEGRHRRAYFVTLCGNVVGLVNHAAFLVVFAIYLVTPLAIFNVLSVALFAFALVLQKRYGRTLTAMTLGASEVVAHQIVAVVILGWGYGFQFYLIVVPAYLFLGHFERRSIPITLSIISVVALGWLWLHGQYVAAPHAELPPTPRLALFGLNLLSTAALVSLFSLIYHHTARQNEDQLLAAREAAEAASRAKSDFLANMSHELRTPLNAIIGYSEMLSEDTDDPETTADLERIRTAGGHLLGLINDILDLSKIEAGRLETVSEPFNLHELLDGVRQMFAPMAEATDVGLGLEIGEGVPQQLDGDAMRLRQVLTNLVGNAVKFTERGRVGVAAKMCGDAGGTVHVEFSVEDTGIGIDQAQLVQIFEPFTQADASVERKFGGTGLGLSISRRLVEVMGGEFEAHSELGVGSRFVFQLPFSARPDPER